MPSSTSSGAIYDTGVYGTAVYGVSNIEILVDGAEGTGEVTTPIQISSLPGLEATFAIGTLSFETNNYLDVTGIGINATVNNVIVAAGSKVNANGASSTGSVGTVFVRESVTLTMPSFILILRLKI